MDAHSLMTSPDAAHYLTLAPQTLRAWRVTGKGPRYHRIGGNRVVYRRADLDEWLAGRTFTSTSEEQRAAGR
jgi:predicted DNA-binding transcriptional regulator AlpA